jgi:hypothetical protein
VIALEAGWHPLRVEFFEKTGGDALSVSIEGPGTSKQLLPKSWIAHTVKP